MASRADLYSSESISPEIEKLTGSEMKHSQREVSAEDGLSREREKDGNVSSSIHEEEGQEARVLSHKEQFPVDPDAPVETHQFTIRAVLVGCILGGVISASNIYLGLKTGWTFGASLFGSIFGFAILKPLSRALPTWIGGGYFGPKENCVVQSAATAAGSLGLVFTSGFPAAYQLGLMSAPQQDYGRLVTFTIACAYYGMFFAIPLRKFYILKQKLAFPSAVAAAFAIHSLHTGKNAEADARKKTYALAIAFLVSITWRCVSEYAPGIMWDWHWGWTLYRLGWAQAIQVENWNWVVEFTPAFLGVGLLVGLNGAYSFFGGSILAWAIIGPLLVSTGTAIGEAISPEYPGYMQYMGMVLDDPVNQPSPRYWMMWPGVMLLLAGAFAELTANYKTIGASFASLLAPLFKPLWRRISRQYGVTGVDGESEDEVGDENTNKIYEPCPPEEMVPAWMWGGGIVVSIIFTCAILGTQYQQNVGVVLLAILIAFVLSFIGAESTGRTNITPVTSIGNASQLILGGANHGHGSLGAQQLLNITGSMLALGAAYQSSDMLGDLKTTHLLRASPRAQFYAQCCGAIVSVFMCSAMYLLFSTAYPCINDLSLQATCSFSAPDVGPCRAIAVAVTSPSLPIPPSSGYLSIALLVWAFVQTFLKYRVVPEKYRAFVPNLVGMGIAFILNTTTYPTAMAFGATVAFLWKRNYPGAFAMYCYAIAAGMIAGEGLGGIVGAVLQVAKVSGNYYGTAIGCPMNEYCG